MPEQLKPPQSTEWKRPEEELPPLPEHLDRPTTILVYGYLREVGNLKTLLAGLRKEDVDIDLTADPADVDRIRREKPKGVVILDNVVLEGVRRHIVSEAELRALYEKTSGRTVADLTRELTEKFNYPWPPEPNLYLYVSPAKTKEHERFINGSLIVGLTEKDLELLDAYELPPIYRRIRTPSISIGGVRYSPKHITFYAGSIGNPHVVAKDPETIKKMTAFEQIAHAKTPDLPPPTGSSDTTTSPENRVSVMYLQENREPGKLPAHAKWPKRVSRRPGFKLPREK